MTPTTSQTPQSTPLEGRQAQKDLLRLSTAGSVDDGKSTLIGRLLYDSQSIYEDQLYAVSRASAGRSAGALDLSLLTDGLRAEREQGITIDVAYRYFATARRKFILSDTPGHEQYTRNMATGASTADVAILLIDARKGVLEQSRRHAYIASLLGIKELVIAVNKMDLIAYDGEQFNVIREQFSPVLTTMNFKNIYWIPVSALAGDNVVHRSHNMPWFGGQSLLDHLETIELPETRSFVPFRFPVQGVTHPNQDFRGYHGQIVSGHIATGDPVVLLPAQRRTHVESISTYDGVLADAFAPMPVTLVLRDQIDISRGDVIASATSLPFVSRDLLAKLIWFDERPLRQSYKYLIKHNTQLTRAEITAVRHRVNIHTFTQEEAGTLVMNEVGEVEISTAQPLVFDPYGENRQTGCAILIDPETNSTAAAVMLKTSISTQRKECSHVGAQRLAPLTVEERIALWGHRSALIELSGDETLAYRLEHWLIEHGCHGVVLKHWNQAASQLLQESGFIVISIAPTPTGTAIQINGLPDDEENAIEKIVDLLVQSNVLRSNIL